MPNLHIRAAWGLLIVSGLGLRIPCGQPLGILVQQEPLANVRVHRAPACKARQWLRLRGGTDLPLGAEDDIGMDSSLLMPRQAPSGVLLLPEDIESLQDAVKIVEQRQEHCNASAALEAEHHASEILVTNDISEESREWGTRHDGFTPLTIRGVMSFKMEHGVNLQGPIDLQPSSGGKFVRWKWGCYLHLRLPQEAALSVAGGPWQMHRCTLRAAEMPVIRAFTAANLSLHDNFVGGMVSPVSCIACRVSRV